MGRIRERVDFDWAGGDASSRRAIAREPGDPDIVGSAAYSAATLGRFEEALPLASQAIDLDPLNADSWECLGETEYFMGQLDKAAADGKKGLELSPDAWPRPYPVKPNLCDTGAASGCFAGNRARTRSFPTCISVSDCVLRAWSEKG